MRNYCYVKSIGFAFWRVYGVVRVLLMHCPTTETVFQSNRVVSQPCPFNRYAIAYENGTQTCTRCSVCARGFQLETKCSAYNDTACEACASGWYNDISGSSCQPCSGCPYGHYIRRQCSSKRNTACRQCPRNTYTAKANVTFCITCSRCRQYQDTVSKCDGYKDTKCGHCDEAHFRLSSTGSCLPCTRCPAELQHWVVQECSDKRGKHHPDICWPGNSYIDGASSSSSLEGTVTVVTDERIENRKDGNWGDDIYIVFIVALLCSVSCGIIVIGCVYQRVHMVRSSTFIQRLNEDENAEDNINVAAIPLMSVYRSAGDKINISDDRNETSIYDDSLKKLTAEDIETTMVMVSAYRFSGDNINISDDSDENWISDGSLNELNAEENATAVSVFHTPSDKLNISGDSDENWISDGSLNKLNAEENATAIPMVSVFQTPSDKLNISDDSDENTISDVRINVKVN